MTAGAIARGRPLVVLAAAMLAAGCGGPSPQREQMGRAPLGTRLAAADAAMGRRLFAVCGACHVDAPSAGDRDAPNLWGVVGSPVAQNSPTFAYSAALRAVGGTWTCEKLDAWLTNPQHFAPGTVMLFPGLPNGADRADVMAYLSEQGPKNAGLKCGPPRRG